LLLVTMCIEFRGGPRLCVQAVMHVTCDVEREQLYAVVHDRITVRVSGAVSWLALR
jgi:hypothetical protein